MKKYEVLQHELQQRDRVSRLSEHDYTEKNTKFFAPVLESANRIHQQLASAATTPPSSTSAGKKTKKTKKKTAVKKEEDSLFDEEQPPAATNDVIKEEEPAIYEHFFDSSQDQNIDKIFGIKKAANGTDFYFGKKLIHFTDNDGFALTGSPRTVYDNLSQNVWNLIMLKNPLEVTQPSQDDYNTYQEILYGVGMNQYVSALPNKIRKTLGGNTKWEKIIQPLTTTTRNLARKNNNRKSPKKQRRRGAEKKGWGLYTTVKPSFLLSRRKKKRKNNNRKVTVAEGSGIEYLPEDISSLRKQLFYLTAEFHSGNLSVRNKIVAILKNLRNRNTISPEEYRIQLNSIDE